MCTITNKEAVIYIHGKGGTPQEAEHYRSFFPHADLYGLDYVSSDPWHAASEFKSRIRPLKSQYSRITLIAVSIGAYFAMNAGIAPCIDRAYFISPIVDMEQLILDMLQWAGTTQTELEKRRVIPVPFGEDLSWDYLQYVHAHLIDWNVPTQILYGSKDGLQSLQTVQAFAQKISAGLTVMEGGEHWFHTDEQMMFLDRWLTQKHNNGEWI